MIDFLIQWGALTIASIALVQPWLIALWKKVFRAGDVHIHKTGNIQISFCTSGPIIGLQGTLRSVHRDMFIRSIDLRVVRLRDNSEHKFSWAVFRSPLAQQGASQTDSQVCSGFVLNERESFTYNIQFLDRATEQIMNTNNETVRQAWTDKIQETININMLQQLSQDPEIGRKVNELIGRLYVEFTKTKPHVEGFSFAQRQCYWESGVYLLEMSVYTSKPDRTFTERWEFELTEQQAESLRLNATPIMLELCGQLALPYYFALSNYKNLPAKR